MSNKPDALEASSFSWATTGTLIEQICCHDYLLWRYIIHTMSLYTIRDIARPWHASLRCTTSRWDRWSRNYEEATWIYEKMRYSEIFVW